MRQAVVLLLHLGLLILVVVVMVLLLWLVLRRWLLLERRRGGGRIGGAVVVVVSVVFVGGGLYMLTCIRRDGGGGTRSVSSIRDGGGGSSSGGTGSTGGGGGIVWGHSRGRVARLAAGGVGMGGRSHRLSRTDSSFAAGVQDGWCRDKMELLFALRRGKRSVLAASRPPRLIKVLMGSHRTDPCRAKGLPPHGDGKQRR